MVILRGYIHKSIILSFYQVEKQLLFNFHVKPCIHCAIFVRFWADFWIIQLFFFWVGMNFSFAMCVLLRSVPTGNRIDKLISDILVTSHEVNKQLKQCYEPTALNTNETLVTWCDVWKDAMEATQFRVWGIPRVYFPCILWAVKFHLDIGLHRVSTKPLHTIYSHSESWYLTKT